MGRVKSLGIFLGLLDDCSENRDELVTFVELVLQFWLGENLVGGEQTQPIVGLTCFLCAMLYFDTKSARLCPACPSSMLAPMDVPDRNNCRPNMRPTPGRSSSR